MNGGLSDELQKKRGGGGRLEKKAVEKLKSRPSTVAAVITEIPGGRPGD